MCDILMTRPMDSVVVYLTLSTQNKQSIHYMDITYMYIAFYYSTTHQSHVKQTCEAVCPFNKYLQKCTFRSFQYTYCTSKLLLALEFFQRKMCQWHLHYILYVCVSKQSNCCIKGIINIKNNTMYGNMGSYRIYFQLRKNSCLKYCQCGTLAFMLI